MIFNSVYQPASSTGGVLGTSKIDLTSTSFAQLFADATNYSGTATYKKGDLAYNQNAIWVYVNNTSASGNPPPTLPTISNSYWELVGSQGTFTWIAYSTSPDGSDNFTTGAFDTGGIVRSYIGIAPNQTSSTESTDYTKYTWSKFRESAPIFIGLSRPTVTIQTDTNGNNGIYTNSGTNISVYEGQSLLEYNASWNGTSAATSTWKLSTTPSGSSINAGNLQPDTQSYAIIGDHYSITQPTASVLYTIIGRNSSGVAFGPLTISQNFTRALGGVLDTTRPADVTFPGSPFSSGGITTTSTGDVVASLTFTWNAVADADISYYEIGISRTSGSNYTIFNTSATSYTWTALEPNTTYYFQARAVDKNANKSLNWTSPTTNNFTTAGKSDPPTANPTWNEAVAAFKNIFLSWTNIADKDLGYVEVYRNTVNNSSTAQKIATTRVSPSTIGSFTDSSGVSTGILYYYWLKSVNTSNVAVTAFSSLPTSVIGSGLTVSSTSGLFTCSSTTGLKIGQVVLITGTKTGAGGITNTDTAYVISQVNSATTFTLVRSDGVALVTVLGATTGWTYTRYISAAIPGAIGAADIIAGSITADRIRAGELTADLISVPTDPLKGLNPSIKIGNTGVTIDTVKTNADDPAARINNVSTIIDPGKISVNGTQTIQSTVSTWVYPNKTTIDGGTIEARTISADKIEVGLTGLQFINLNWEIDTTTANTVKWYSGGGTPNVVYRSDSGASVTSPLQAGSATWSGGTVYLYWVKPVTGTITATYVGTTITLTFPAQADAVSPFYIGDIINVSGITATGNAPNGTFTVTGSTATTVVYTATATPSGTLGGSIVIAPSIAGSTARGNAYRSNTVPIGTYQGGRKLTINYGKTIINGADITTGTVNANVLEADSGILNRLYLGSPSVPRFTLNGNTYGGNEGLITISDASSQPLVKMGYLDASTVGFELRNSSNQVLLNTSTPVSSIDNGQTGINLANIVYSQFNQATLPVIPTNGSTGTFSIVLDSAPSPAAPVSGLGSIRINTGASSTCYAYLAGTFGAYNIVLKPNTTYLYSAYVKAATASVAGQLRIRLDDVGTDASTSFTTSGTANTWTRVSTTFTTNSGTTSAGVRVANTTSSSSLWFTGIMIEEARGASATIPSPYVAPSLNGLITSSNTSTYISSLKADVIQLDNLTLDTDGSGNLKIKLLGVDTSYIANNAVSVVTSTYTAGTVNFSNTLSGSAVPIDLVTPMTVVTSGIGTVTILVNLEVTGGTASGSYGISVIRDGTTTIETGNGAVNGSTYTGFTYVFTDSPTAGTHTYKITATSAGSPGIYTARKRFLMVMENKK